MECASKPHLPTNSAATMDSSVGSPALSLFARQSLTTSLSQTGASPTARELASTLLGALRAPTTLEWTASFGPDLEVRVTAELSQETRQWPPRHAFVEVRRGPAGPRVGVLANSSATEDQWESLLSGAVAAIEDQLPMAGRTLEPAPVGTPPDSRAAVEALDVLMRDEQRGVVQARCLTQWHYATCSHHALYNISCLLRGDAAALRDEVQFWRFALNNVNRLAQYGEESKRWPKSRVTSGTADGVHVRHLIDTDPVLSNRISVVESKEQFDVCPGLDILRNGYNRSYGFMLGSTTHWYSAVAIPASSSAPPLLCFFDSHHSGLALLRNAADVEAAAAKVIEERRQKDVEKLKHDPEWMHRPPGDIEAMIRDGLPEWWKGHHKTPLFWKYQPLDLQMRLCLNEFEDIRHYLDSLLKALEANAAVNSAKRCDTPAKF